MAVGIRTISVRFLGDTKDLEKAGDTGASSMGKWQSAFKKLDKVATGVLIGLGGAIIGSVVAMASMGDEIAKSAQKAGVGAEQYQELRFAFEQSGIAAGTFNTALQKFNRRLGEASEGSGPAAERFEMLGISIKDAGGEIRDSGEVLDETLVALAGIESDAERAAAAGELLGQRAGPELASALGDGIEGIDEARERAQELGIVMDEDALAASEDFSDAMNELKLVGAAFIRDFAGPFLDVFVNDIVPVLNERVIPAVTTFGDFLSENSTLVVTIAGILLGLAAAIKVVAVVIKAVTIVQAIWNAVTAANPIVLIILAIIALIAIIVLLIKNWDTVVEVLKKAWEVIKAAFFTAIDFIVNLIVGFFNFYIGLWKKLWSLVVAGARAAWGFIVGAFDRGRELVTAGVQAVRDFIVNTWNNILSFVKKLPGKIASRVRGMWDGLTSAFRDAVNGIIDAWNRLSFTVGGGSFLGVDIPSFTLDTPNLPRLHEGGTVPGAPGQEVLALLEGGEEVTPADERGGRGGDTTNVFVQAWSDRFSFAQVERELAMHGVT